MKRINIFLAMLLVLVMSTASYRAEAQVRASVSFQFFYDNLSVHGSWMSNPDYGYVWRPSVARGFHPYRTNGHWVWSDEYGWVWASDYEWGWAPFHYGRWYYDNYYGWLWTPDYEWAPAWVVWRGGGDYYGWAPIAPGINISLSFGSYSPAYSYWSFVPRQYIASPVVYNYYVSPQQNTTIINNTTVINNYGRDGGPTRNVYVNGPQRTEVERATGQSIKPVRVSETSSPGRTRVADNSMMIYKPRVDAGDKRSAKPAKVTAAERRTTEPAKTQPTRTQPEKTQPTRTQPTRTEPRKEQPTRTQPTRTQPERTQPTRTEPKKEQPVRTQPTRTQPERTQPTRTQPEKTQPTRTQPERTQPTRTQPEKTQPTRTQPERTQPTRMPPEKTQPAKPQQQKEQPAKEELQKNQPRKKNG